MPYLRKSGWKWQVSGVPYAALGKKNAGHMARRKSNREVMRGYHAAAPHDVYLGAPCIPARPLGAKPLCAQGIAIFVFQGRVLPDGGR